MPLNFYPHSDDANKGSLEERLSVLLDAADRYKAHVLDVNIAGTTTPTDEPSTVSNKRLAPRDIEASYNWDEIARVLREIRELPEGEKKDKARKSNLMNKLAEIYEILRAAKMPKLEAVRLALVAEVNHLNGSL